MRRLGIDERPFLLTPSRCRQNHIGHLGGFSVGVHILHDKKIEPVEDIVALVLIDPRVRRICADNPQTANPSPQNSFHNLIVWQRVLGRYQSRVDAQNVGDFFAMFGVGKIVASQQIGRIAEQPRAHCVALTGNAIRPGARPSDIAGHQCEIDDRLSGADSLMTLVDPHRPPEGATFAEMNRLSHTVQLFRRESRLRRNPLICELLNVLGVFREFVRVGGDKFFVNPPILDQDAGNSVEQCLIGLRSEPQMLRRVHRRLGHPRINDDDLGRVRIPHHSFPHDGMRDAQIAADQNNDVRLFKISVGVWRRIEAECLFVGHNGGRHTLPGIAVSVQQPHAEFCQRTQKRHLFRRDLSGTEKRDGVWSVLRLNRLKALDKCLHGRIPLDRFEPTGLITQQWCRGPINGVENAHASQPLGQAMPRFTGYSVAGERFVASPSFK